MSASGIPDDANEDVRDRAEAAQLMDLLEHRIVPLLFDRDAQGLPAAWLERIQRSIQALADVFSAHRMVNDYANRIYRPLTRRGGIPLSFEEPLRQDALAV